MDKQETGSQEAIYDYRRYKQLLAEAVDETKRLELIETMIRETPATGWRRSRLRIGSR